MTIAPRKAPARRAALAQGRRRLALLAAAAGLAVAGAALPTVAGSQEAPAQCADQPAGAIVTVAGADPVTCPQPDTATTASATEPATTTAGPAETAPPVTEPAPVTTQTTPPPSSTTDPAPTDPAPVASDPAATPAPADPAPASGDATPDVAQQAVSPAAGRPATGAPPTAPDAPAAGHHAQPAAAHDTPAETAPARRHRPGSQPATKQPAGAEASARPSTPLSVLPSAWTSLDPIVLPAFSAKDFPVPAELLPLFQAAGAEYGVPWEILAAINETETGFGRDMAVSSAGAVGFMQFLPSTWERWGRDGDGDRRRDPRDPADAIFSAARYLDAAGAAGDLPRALFAYNHANWYVQRVMLRARELAGLNADRVAALTDRALEQHRTLYEVAGSPYFGPGVVEPTAGQALLMTSEQLARRVLKDDRIEIYDCGRNDIEAGRVDRRVLATLLFLAASGHSLRVSSLECGHGRLTTSGNVSAHSFGSAVDIAAVDGIPILGHQGGGSIAEEIVYRLLDLQGLNRPAQIITLMTVDGAPNTLSLPDHDDHIHVGFARAVTLEHLR
jgi:soluble lytic murein transglycosylase-like protein